tara:strand:- start:216 stop:386 length:171 start_codon:yes stop_codon:yes gene_type:complete
MEKLKNKTYLELILIKIKNNLNLILSENFSLFRNKLLVMLGGTFSVKILLPKAKTA